ncbi:hypothetical protein BROUX41_000736 [Berkeleyomyces rouxiae]|uniref:uncharacterized protein n=1 Tax=Berkeleyomyces rouxiae TaxID=2035830 RepID=UPI003B78B60C
MLSSNNPSSETSKSSASSSPFLHNGPAAAIGPRSTTPRLASFEIPSPASDMTPNFSDSPVDLACSPRVSPRDPSFTLNRSMASSRTASHDSTVSYLDREYIQAHVDCPDQTAHNPCIPLEKSATRIDEDTTFYQSANESRYLFLGAAVNNLCLSSKKANETVDMSVQSISSDTGSSTEPTRPSPPVFSATTMSQPSTNPLIFSAFRHLPVAVAVLDDTKSIAFTNDAMSRLLSGTVDAEKSTSQASYYGLSLTQLRVSGNENGQPIQVSWDTILDHVATKKKLPTTSSGDSSVSRFTTCAIQNNKLPDFAIDVIFSPFIVKEHSILDTCNQGSRTVSEESRPCAGGCVPSDTLSQVHATMIITTWLDESNRRFFTLTLTEVAHVTQEVLSLSSAASSHKSYETQSSSSQDSADRPQHNPPSIEDPAFLQRLAMLKDALIDNTNMPIVGIWKDGTIAYPNKAARSMFGQHTTDNRPFYMTELIADWVLWNEKFTTRIPPNEYPMRLLMETLEPFEGKRIGMVKDGRRVVYDVIGEVIRDLSSGECLGGVVSYRDVTQLAEDITRYEKSDDERFRTMCDSMPQLVWAVQPDGFPNFFNRQWYEYTGLTREECQHYRIQDVIHPEDEEEALDVWARCLKTGEPFQAEYRFCRRDGTSRWFLSRALPLRSSPDGPITGWFGTSTDVHEAVITKRITERTKEQLKSVMAHAKVTLFTVDKKLNITMLEGGLVGHGIPDDTDANGQGWFIGHNVYEVFGGLDEMRSDAEHLAFLRPIESVLMGNDAEHVMEHNINGRWYRTRFVPMYSSETTGGPVQEERKPPVIDGVIGVIMDITEHHAAIEEETKRMQQAVANEEAAKEATRLKSQFLANMSHEFRTPITWVLGYTDILKTTPMNMEQEQIVSTIRNSATILLTLINDILDFSKIESGKMGLDEIDFDLSSVLHDATEMRRFEAKNKQIEFITVYAPGINQLRLAGDSNRLRQILNNILDNSIKFTREGFVLLRVEYELETTDSIMLKFIVQDSGVGIELRKQDHIFEPFHQADASTAREFGGTGLGLSICKSFLDLMHGQIAITSEHSRGTTVTIKIPFRIGEAPCEEETCPVSNPMLGCYPRMQNYTAAANGGKIMCHAEIGLRLPRPAKLLISQSESLTSRERPARNECVRRKSIASGNLSLPHREKTHILLVEDNPLNAKLMIKLLGQIHFKSCTHMVNGKEALDFIDRAQRGVEQKPDLILMDCQMPILDGYQCSKALRNNEKYREYMRNVPIIAVTASAVAGDKEKCLKSGMNDYLLKPITQSLLERSIMGWLTAPKRRAAAHEQGSSSEQTAADHSYSDATNDGIASTSF